MIQKTPHILGGGGEGTFTLHVSDLLRANETLFFFFDTPSWHKDPNARKEAVMTSVRNELALANAQELINVRAQKRNMSSFPLRVSHPRPLPHDHIRMSPHMRRRIAHFLIPSSSAGLYKTFTHTKNRKRMRNATQSA